MLSWNIATPSTLLTAVTCNPDYHPRSVSGVFGDATPGVIAIIVGWVAHLAGTLGVRRWAAMQYRRGIAPREMTLRVVGDHMSLECGTQRHTLAEARAVLVELQYGAGWGVALDTSEGRIWVASDSDRVVVERALEYLCALSRADRAPTTHREPQRLSKGDPEYLLDTTLGLLLPALVWAWLLPHRGAATALVIAALWLLHYGVTLRVAVWGWHTTSTTDEG